jgi:hypothetical protein
VVGWLEDQDAKNQRRADADRERFGGDDWAERLDDEVPDLHRAVYAVRGAVFGFFAVGLVVAALIFLLRWIAAVN